MKLLSFGELPLEVVFRKVLSLSESMRLFLQQLRQETGVRVVEKVFDADTDKPSKVRWLPCHCSLFI